MRAASSALSLIAGAGAARAACSDITGVYSDSGPTGGKLNIRQGGCQWVAVWENTEWYAFGTVSGTAVDMRISQDAGCRSCDSNAATVQSSGTIRFNDGGAQWTKVGSLQSLPASSAGCSNINGDYSDSGPAGGTVEVVAFNCRFGAVWADNANQFAIGTVSGTSVEMGISRGVSCGCNSDAATVQSSGTIRFNDGGAQWTAAGPLPPPPSPPAPTPRPPPRPPTPTPPRPTPRPPSPPGKVPNVEIAPGVHMPVSSLGSCCGSDPNVGLVPWTQAGGRGIDTSDDYGTQGAINNAWHRSGVPRGDLFIGSKVSGNSDQALNTIKRDLNDLGTSYLDLVLIHHPGSDDDNIRQWRDMETAVEQNLTRAIGVSNFNIGQLQAIQRIAKVKIAVNQCEMHVQHTDDNTISYCQQQGITYMAYWATRNCDSNNGVLKSIAAKHGKSVFQVCLRYIVDKGCIMAVGTGGDGNSVGEYAREDLAIFDFKLSGDEVNQIHNI